MIGVSIALIINYKSVDEQMDRLKAHAPNALMMAVVIVGAGMFLGILDETGMLKAISTSFIHIIPQPVGPYIHIIVGIFGVPLDLLTSTDAYYFALLPIVKQTAAEFGVSQVSTAYSMVIGNIGTFVVHLRQQYGCTWFSRSQHGHIYKYAFFWVWGFATYCFLAVSSLTTGTEV